MNTLKLRDREIELGKKTLIMGILNVTPDSFSDGGLFCDAEAAISHAAEMVKAGADIIDIGAESTRPGSLPVTAEVEIARLGRVIPAIKKLGVPISIDTYKPVVAEFALEQGADIINDISGIEIDHMIPTAEKFNAPIIAMHNQVMFYNYDIIGDIRKFFSYTLERFPGVQIIFDVGIGFGKLPDENLAVLRQMHELKNIDGVEVPLMLGVSRKSVIGYAAQFEVGQRDEATGAICVLAVAQGVDILRVHNVFMISRMIRMADVLARGEFDGPYYFDKP